jgi:hypothetical protein
MKHILIIKADTNDADYVHTIQEITLDGVKTIAPIAEAIKNFQPYKSNLSGLDWTHRSNWPVGDCLRDDLGEKSPAEIYAGVLNEDQIELFMDLIPYGEHGIHTIKSIKILAVENETVLL